MSDDEPPNKKTIMGYAAPDMLKHLEESAAVPSTTGPAPHTAHGPPSKGTLPGNKSRTRGFVLAGVVLAIAAIVVLAVTADDKGETAETESATLASAAAPSPESNATSGATSDARAQLPDAPLAEPSDFDSRFEAATKLEPARASRKTDWPCTSSYDRSSDGVIDAEITYTYGGPSSCSVPPNLLLFGCPTQAVTKSSDGIISRKEFLSYDAKGQLLAARTEKRDTTIRVLFRYHDQVVIESETDSDKDGVVDYQSAYETVDDKVMWYRHASDRSEPSSTMHLEEGRLVLADSSRVSKAFRWEGDRVVSEVARMGERAVATFTFGYACDGAEERTSADTTVDLAKIEPACMKSGRRALKKCLLAAKALKDGTGGPADPRMALALFDRTCEQKSGLGCLGAALIAGSSELGAHDDAKATDYAERACLYGMGAGCSMAGIAHDKGGVVPKDLTKAVTFYTKACEMDDSPGCTNLGAMYAEGTGVAQSGPLAIKFLTKACEKDEPRGCGILGIVLGQGKVVEKDTDEARVMLGKSCQLGFAPACEMKSKL